MSNNHPTAHKSSSASVEGGALRVATAAEEVHVTSMGHQGLIGLMSPPATSNTHSNTAMVNNKRCHNKTDLVDSGQYQQQQQRRVNINTTTTNNNNNNAPLADQFSSSLASIASSARHQALHHQQSTSSSSSSDTSSNNAAVVTANTSSTGTGGGGTSTTTGSASGSGSGGASNNNSSGEDRESGGDRDNDNDADKDNDAHHRGMSMPSSSNLLAHHSYHHHHHHLAVQQLPPSHHNEDTGKSNSNAPNTNTSTAKPLHHHHAMLHHNHANSSHHYFAALSRRNKREHDFAGGPGDKYGLPLSVDDDLLQEANAARNNASTMTNAAAASSHHATVMARLPPPDTQSSLSSSGNEGSTTSSSLLIKSHREPVYHTIQQTLLLQKKSSSSTQRNKSSSKKKTRKDKQAETASSSDSSGDQAAPHKRHTHHHHKRSSASAGLLADGTSGGPSKKKQKSSSSSSKLFKTGGSNCNSSSHQQMTKQSSSGTLGASSKVDAFVATATSNKKVSTHTTATTATTSMTRKKKRSSQLSSPSTEAAPSAATPKARTATEDDENYGSNSSSCSGTEAGYAGSASSNEARKSGEDGSNGGSSGNSTSDIPDFSSGASESNAYAFGSSPSKSPSLSSSNGDDDDDDDDEDDSLDDDGECKPSAVSKTVANTNDSTMAKPKSWLTATTAPPAASLTPSAHAASPLKPTPSASVALASATSQFVKISRLSAVATCNRKMAAKQSPRSSTPAARRSSYPASALQHASRLETSAALSPQQQLVQHQQQKAPIMRLGSDLMAHVLTFLEPPDILRVLTMPLSKDWLVTFAGQQELWRVLCILEPFKAQVGEEDFSSSSSSSSSCTSSDDDDDGSLSSFSASNSNDKNHKSSSSNNNKNNNDSIISSSNNNGLPTAVWKSNSNSSSSKKKAAGSARHLGKLGKYRLLYTSFVRCMKYLARMKEDVLHGRPPSMIDYGGSSAMTQQNLGSNRSLQRFLAGARDIVESQQEQQQQVQPAQQQEAENVPPAAAAAAAANVPIMSADDGSSSYESSTQRRRKRKKSRDSSTRRKKPKFGRSMLTDRLLGPSASGDVNPENVTLPWSCALYSIVNWMVAFADVEGIQIMCLKVLPFLLEDEQQRITAQRVGLTDVILRDMMLFPDSVQLHTASFHTLVLLARPLGGREGMLFHSSMVNAAGIFSGANRTVIHGSETGDDSAGQASMFSGGAQSDGKNGIAVMLDSMRRFEDDEALQAMSCWSLVNIALAPVQKEVLVKLGGIEVTTNAMMRHPHNAEVQFRALFALINLVIPSVNVTEDNADGQGNLAEELDEMVGQITNLVVLAMKNFCSSEAILNRACLVLHNLSLTQGYHTTLFWTPNCYQMLEWCLANYRTDQVLQQSAAGTLHRLQVTLSNDDSLRARFAASIQAQQQLSLEAAHREAIQFYEQQEQLRQERGSGARTAD